MSFKELAEQPGRGLAFEVYALRDIQPGMFAGAGCEKAFEAAETVANTLAAFRSVASSPLDLRLLLTTLAVMLTKIEQEKKFLWIMA